MKSKCLIVVMGPTASGKTALSIAIAQYFNSIIVNVDSRQVFQELEIGTARPTQKELDIVKHYFVGDRSVNVPFTAGSFAKEAQDLLDCLFKEHNIIIASGGSTLYFGALLHGIDKFPSVSDAIKEQVNGISSRGLSFLQDATMKADPEYYATADKENPRRLSRALEVSLASGQPYSSFLNQDKDKLPYPTIKIGIDLPRKQLYDRINQRCDEMLTNGLIDEVKAMYPYRDKQALQTVGYKEFFEWMDGRCTYEEAVNLFKQHTRNYAKRQMTWFRREEGIQWFPDNNPVSIISFLRNELGEKR